MCSQSAPLGDTQDLPQLGEGDRVGVRLLGEPLLVLGTVNLQHTGTGDQQQLTTSAALIGSDLGRISWHVFELAG